MGEYEDSVIEKERDRILDEAKKNFKSYGGEFDKYDDGLWYYIQLAKICKRLK